MLSKGGGHRVFQSLIVRKEKLVVVVVVVVGHALSHYSSPFLTLVFSMFLFV